MTNLPIRWPGAPGQSFNHMAKLVIVVRTLALYIELKSLELAFQLHTCT